MLLILLELLLLSLLSRHEIIFSRSLLHFALHTLTFWLCSPFNSYPYSCILQFHSTYCCHLFIRIYSFLNQFMSIYVNGWLCTYVQIISVIPANGMKHDIGIPCIYAYSKVKLNYSVHYLCLCAVLSCSTFFESGLIFFLSERRNVNAICFTHDRIRKCGFEMRGGSNRERERELKLKVMFILSVYLSLSCCKYILRVFSGHLRVSSLNR